jgi:hypothetical protein
LRDGDCETSSENEPCILDPEFASDVELKKLEKEGKNNEPVLLEHDDMWKLRWGFC